MVVLILVVAWPILRGEPASPTGPTGPTAPVASGGAATGPSSVDLSSMTPREAADRLYLRVVRTAAAGDTAGAVGFVPMTVAAFDQARPLDADGLFHLTQVHSVAGDHASMLAAAEEALADSPNHLLNLHAAGTAAADLGDTVRALEHYRRLLEVWDEEMASGNADYESHALMMDEARSSAEAYVAANGG
jgi:tetratricopeptide (TPR) repeat protein